MRRFAQAGRWQWNSEKIVQACLASLRSPAAKNGKIHIAPVAANVREARFLEPFDLIFYGGGKIFLKVFSEPRIVRLAVGLDKLAPPFLVPLG